LMNCDNAKLEEKKKRAESHRSAAGSGGGGMGGGWGGRDRRPLGHLAVGRQLVR
jgi:hypothetical protein